MELREQIAKKAFVGGVVSLVLSPLFVLLGYWLNHTLAAPKLRVEYARPVVIVNNAQLDWGAVAELRKNTILAANIRDVLLRIGVSRNHQPCIDWLEHDTWSNDCAEDAKLALQYYSSMQSAKVDELERWVATARAGKSPQPVAFAALDPYFVRLGNDKTAVQSGMTAYLESSRQDRKALAAFVQRFNATVDSEGSRTGNIEVRVGVLNTGDSDGVITRGAVLRFGDSEVLMRAPRYTVVKAHSIEDITYVINTDASVALHLEKLRSLVRARGQDSFSIAIRSTDETMTMSARFPE